VVSALVSVKMMAIHNFSKKIRVQTQEVKVVQCETKPLAEMPQLKASAVVEPRVKKLPERKKAVAAEKLPTKKPILGVVEMTPLLPSSNPKLPQTPLPPSSNPKLPQTPSPSPVADALSSDSRVSANPNYQVYRLGDVFTGRRILMKQLGIDIGTKTVVVAYRGDDGEIGYISEINGWWPFERATKFIEKLLADPTKVRSDGTQRPARWIKMPETNQIVVLGKDAEEFAYAKNDTLRRPMAEGGISADEEAMIILASIVQGLMEMAETELGEFGDSVKITYCTTAPAINKRSSNVEYHERVVNLIIEGYETKAKVELVGPYDDHQGAIKESHAIVLDMDDQHGNEGTGIGISWGAGTVTVSYVKWGEEIYSFCWVGAGDWIDNEVAKRHGYEPDVMSIMKKAKETPTTVAKRKETVDLTPGIEPEDRVGLDIVLHYDVLIAKVIEGVVAGFVENEDRARIDGAVNIYMAGGTSSPQGFVERVAAKFDEKDLPFEIGQIFKSDKPLYCVATGCLKAAEMF